MRISKIMLVAAMLFIPAIATAQPPPAHASTQISQHHAARKANHSAWQKREATRRATAARFSVHDRARKAKLAAAASRRRATRDAADRGRPAR